VKLTVPADITNATSFILMYCVTCTFR